MEPDEVANHELAVNDRDALFRRIYGSAEYIRGLVRYCLLDTRMKTYAFASGEINIW